MRERERGKVATGFEHRTGVCKVGCFRKGGELREHEKRAN